jgi:hypothetical protein
MSDPYLQAFKGSFKSTLRWEQLERFWEVLRPRAGEGWYVYAVGEMPPERTASAEGVERFIQEVDRLIREEHDESFCGIVFADNLEQPSFIKIYDPGNLGVVCGYSERPPLPGWTLSKLKPVDLEVAMPPPGNRRRWWQRIFGT